MGGASFFVLGGVGQTEGHRGQKTRAGTSLSEVNLPPSTPLRPTQILFPPYQSINESIKIFLEWPK